MAPALIPLGSPWRRASTRTRVVWLPTWSGENHIRRFLAQLAVPSPDGEEALARVPGALLRTR